MCRTTNIHARSNCTVRMRVFLQKPRGNKLRYDVAYTNKGVAMYHKSDTQGLNKTKNSGSDLEFVVFFCFLLAVAHSF